MATTQESAFLKTKEAAAFIGFSVATLLRLPIRRYPMPGRGTGRRPRFWYRRTDLEAYVKALTNPASRNPAKRRPTYAFWQKREDA